MRHPRIIVGESAWPSRPPSAVMTIWPRADLPDTYHRGMTPPPKPAAPNGGSGASSCSPYGYNVLAWIHRVNSGRVRRVDAKGAP